MQVAAAFTPRCARCSDSEECSLIGDGSCNEGNEPTASSRFDPESRRIMESWEGIAALPPLPERRSGVMCAQSILGYVIVLYLIAIFVSMTLACAYHSQDWRRYLFGSLIIAEAVTALTCLGVIMFGDPGEVRREPDTCFPVPDVVTERLQKGQTLDGLDNVVDAEGRVYCVRCCVWRPDNTETHHCSVCCRCVRDYDHHCGVFGRCIAGPIVSLRGNHSYFIVLIAMAVAGAITTLSATYSIGSALFKYVFIASGFEKMVSSALNTVTTMIETSGNAAAAAQIMKQYRETVKP